MARNNHSKETLAGQIPIAKIVVDSGWRQVQGVQVRTAVIDGPHSELRRRWFEAHVIKVESNRTAA